MDGQSVPDPGGSKPSSPIWTAIQHSSGLVAALGLFVALSAYSSDPGSGIVLLGLGIAVAGVAGFLAGRAAKLR